MELQKILTPFEGKMSTNLVRLSLLHIRPRVQRGRDFFKDNFVYLNFIGSSYKKKSPARRSSKPNKYQVFQKLCKRQFKPGKENNKWKLDLQR